MPHFVIDCSPSISSTVSPTDLIREVHIIAEASGLFRTADIKVRIREYENYLVAGETADFIHVFASIMDGRTVAQKAELSKAVVTKLCTLFPDVTTVSMNVWEFENATYSNRNSI